jgi:hypothetical protein
MVSLHDSRMFVMFTEGLDQSVGGFQRKQIRPRHICAVPKRSKCAGKKNIFICPFKKNFKKWNSILTILKIPCKFERYRLRKMALGTNGLMSTTTSTYQRWARATFFRVRNRNSATRRKHFSNRNSATFKRMSLRNRNSAIPQSQFFLKSATQELYFRNFRQIFGVE